jgi:ABC-type branched-subunit amino acid transport system ATPase component/ABC-type branched-subunit amino acid transport system permease subunit
MSRTLNRIRGGLLPQVLAGPALAVLVVLMIDGGIIGASRSYDVALAAVYGIVVLSMSLLAGWGGVWSVGHPALFAIGAYTTVHGTAHGWSMEVVIIVAMALAAASGAFLGYAGARFSVLYISLLTLAFNLVVLEIIGRWQSLTGGDQGMPVGSLDSALGLGSFNSATGATDGVIIAFGIVMAVAVLVRRSALRMRLVAAKSHPAAARTVGIAPELQTALAFAVSGAFAALAGVGLAAMTGYISPEPFGLHFAVNIIAAAVLGGIGSISGAIVGGAFLAMAPTLASEIGVSLPILQGVILIAVLLFLPKGVVPSLVSLGRSLVRRFAPAAAPVAATAAVDPHHVADGAVASANGHESAAPQRAPRGGGVEIKDVSVRFGGLTAIEDVSLEVKPGEVLGIIGPNGAGKTTLINTLSGLSSGGKVGGSIRYGGVELLKKRPTARRGLGIARAFQHAELFDELTVIENLLSAKRRAGAAERREAMQLLERVGLADVADRHPRELPFGLQKRADLARAVAEEPELILLDEPFGGLDEHERAILAEQIRELKDSGATVMIVDHVLDDLFSVTDRVVAFDFGTPVAQGDAATVLEDPRVRASYLGEGGTSERRALPRQGAGEPVVTLTGVAHHYDGVQALRGIDLAIPAGSVVGIVGANGAGKSTLGRIAAGLLKPSEGTVEFGAVAGGAAPRRSLVPEGREIFKTLSVVENLEAAGYGAGLRGGELKARIQELGLWMPERVRNRMNVSAGALSGGEQQMVAIARGLISRPDLLVVDEPALGLAPSLVDDVYSRLTELAAETGITIVLLEQLLGRALAVSHQVVVLRDGLVVAAGDPDDPAFTERAEEAYFGEVSKVLIEDV